jgi:abortive infection bacteriophage resistance protein
MFNESIDNMEELCNNVSNVHARPLLSTESDAEKGVFLFNKPFLTTQEKIALLQERGLVICPEEVSFVQNSLESIGYYRLSGYFHFFYNEKLTDPIVHEQAHLFKSGTTFKQIYQIYKLDEELRLILLQALASIEISLRVTLDLILCKTSTKNPELWYVNQEIYSSVKDFETCFHKILKDADYYAKEEPHHHFIKTFKHKYENQFPPSWMIVETLMFGTLSKIIEKLKRSHRKDIAKNYGYPSDKDFVNTLEQLTKLRNHTAHHSRIWNRMFAPPPVIKEFDDINHAPKEGEHNFSFSNRRIAHFYLIIRYFHQHISDNTSFTEQFKVWYQKVPDGFRSYLGFRHPIEYYDKYFS